MTETWRSNRGSIIELTQVGKRCYAFRFMESKLYFIDYKTRFDALIGASRKLRKSMKSLDWTRE